MEYLTSSLEDKNKITHPIIKVLLLEKEKLQNQIIVQPG